MSEKAEQEFLSVDSIVRLPFTESAGRYLTKFFTKIRDEGKITRRVYRDLYLKAKGNAFRNTAHLRTYIAEHKLGAKR